MVVENQLKRIEALYSDNLRKHGIDSRAVGWNTEDCQALRFSKLSSVIEDNDEKYSVNDYGCGYGAHLKFLTDVLGHNVHAYNGYDISEEMLQTAKKQLSHFDGNLNLLKAETIETQADYTFVSGTFNVRFDASKDDWMEFIRVKLHEIDKNSHKGFSFNLLTSYVDWEEPHLYYGDPCYWFDYCKRNFSKHVTLYHDYPLWEWTVMVKK